MVPVILLPEEGGSPAGVIIGASGAFLALGLGILCLCCYRRPVVVAAAAKKDDCESQGLVVQGEKPKECEKPGSRKKKKMMIPSPMPMKLPMKKASQSGYSGLPTFNLDGAGLKERR